MYVRLLVLKYGIVYTNQGCSHSKIYVLVFDFGSFALNLVYIPTVVGFYINYLRQCFPTCVPRERQRCAAADCRKSKVFNEKFQWSFQLSLKTF